jgi:hypothetical protein
VTTALRAVWSVKASGPSGPVDQVFVAGDQGTILSANGDGTWTAGTGSSDNFVGGALGFAVGIDPVNHVDGIYYSDSINVWVAAHDASGGALGDITAIGQYQATLYAAGFANGFTNRVIVYQPNSGWVSQSAFNLPKPDVLTTLWASDPIYSPTLFALGARTVYRLDSTSNWVSLPGTSGPLHGLGGAGEQMFAVGDGGAIFQALPSETAPINWTKATTNVTVPLYAVAGFTTLFSAPTPSILEAYVVGGGETILEGGINGTWVQRRGGGAHDLFAIWSNGTDFYAVGSGGFILHGKR